MNERLCIDRSLIKQVTRNRHKVHVPLHRIVHDSPERAAEVVKAFAHAVLLVPQVRIRNMDKRGPHRILLLWQSKPGHSGTSTGSRQDQRRNTVYQYVPAQVLVARGITDGNRDSQRHNSPVDIVQVIKVPPWRLWPSNTSVTPSTACKAPRIAVTINEIRHGLFKALLGRSTARSLFPSPPERASSPGEFARSEPSLAPTLALLLSRKKSTSPHTPATSPAASTSTML